MRGIDLKKNFTKLLNQNFFSIFIQQAINLIFSYSLIHLKLFVLLYNHLTYIHTYIHHITYIHTYIHTTHTHTHMHILTFS